MDTGTAVDRITGKAHMYRGEPFTDDLPLLETPVHVWDTAGGSAVETMTTREFNRRYRVQYRFDTSRIPERREEG